MSKDDTLETEEREDDSANMVIQMEVEKEPQTVPFTYSSLIVPLFLPCLLSHTFENAWLVTLLFLLKKELMLNEGQVGTAQSLAGLTAIFCSFLIGTFVRRRGDKFATVVAMVGLMLSTFPLIFFQSYYLACATCVVKGISFSIYKCSRQTLLARLVPNDKRGRTSSILGGMNRIAFIAAPYIAGQLTFLFSTRVAFIFTVAINIPTIACAVALIPGKDHDHKDLAHVDVHPLRSWANRITLIWAEKKRSLVTLMVFCTLIETMRGARILCLTLRALSLGYTTSKAGLVLSTSMAVDSLLFPISGVIMDKFGRKASGIPHQILMCVGFIFLAFANSDGTLFAASAVLGVANAVASGLCMTVAGDSAPKIYRQEYLGIFMAVVDLGVFCSSLMVGWITLLSSLKVTCIVFAVCSAFNALFCAFCCEETLQKKN